MQVKHLFQSAGGVQRGCCDTRRNRSSPDPSGSGERFNYKEIPGAIKKCGNSHSRHPQTSNGFNTDVQLRIFETKIRREDGACKRQRWRKTRQPSHPPDLESPRPHERSSNRRHRQSVYCTNTSEAFLICSLDLLNLFSGFLENSLSRQAACRLRSPRAGWSPAAAQTGSPDRLQVRSREAAFTSPCQMPPRDHKPRLQVRDNTPIPLICPLDSVQKPSTGRLLRCTKGCNPRGL